jgi:phosphatidyl-myo-inositol dimannoside synthase
LNSKRIIGLFPQLLGVGGVQEAGRQTAAALNEIAVRRGSTAEFLSLNDPPPWQTFATSAASGAEIRFRGFGRAKFEFAFSAFREALRGDVHIIVAAHPHLALPAACAKSVSAHARTIVVSHGVEIWQPLPGLRRRALLRADLVLAPSTDTAEKLACVQGASREKTRLLPWPVDPSFLQMAERSGALAPPASFPSGRVILTVGRWSASERYKGADDLIRAFAQLRAQFPGLHLVAVGDGDDLPRLRSIAGETGASNSVHFLSSLSREEIAACYARAEVFALPSAGEGFGLVFLEAMAFGKPVVGAASGGTTDVIQDGANGFLVPPHDPESLSRTLAQLLGNDSLRDQLGRRGAELARGRYSFQAFESSLESILEQCGLDSRKTE